MFNEIDITQPTFITWASDLVATDHMAFLNPITIPNAGTGPGGPLDLVLVDGPAGVPDVTPTLSLLALSLFGLAFVCRMRRALA